MALWDERKWEKERMRPTLKRDRYNTCIYAGRGGPEEGVMQLLAFFSTPRCQVVSQRASPVLVGASIAPVVSLNGVRIFLACGSWCGSVRVKMISDSPPTEADEASEHIATGRLAVCIEQ